MSFLEAFGNLAGGAAQGYQQMGYLKQQKRYADAAERRAEMEEDYRKRELKASEEERRRQQEATKRDALAEAQAESEWEAIRSEYGDRYPEYRPLIDLAAEPSDLVDILGERVPDLQTPRMQADIARIERSNQPKASTGGSGAGRPAGAPTYNQAVEMLYGHFSNPETGEWTISPEEVDRMARDLVSGNPLRPPPREELPGGISFMDYVEGGVPEGSLFSIPTRVPGAQAGGGQPQVGPTRQRGQVIDEIENILRRYERGGG